MCFLAMDYMKISEMKNAIFCAYGKFSKFYSNRDAFYPITELRSKSHYGRPNFVHIFQQMKAAIVEGGYLRNINQDKVHGGLSDLRG